MATISSAQATVCVLSAGDSTGRAARSVLRAEGVPGGGEVGHSAEADPEGLGAGWGFGGAVVVAAESGQQL